MGKAARLRLALRGAHALLCDARTGLVDSDELERTIAEIEELTKPRTHPGRGERHFRAKLNADKVREIRSLYASWKAAGSRKGYAELGEMFGVEWSTIRDAVARKTWGHIE